MRTSTPWWFVRLRCSYRRHGVTTKSLRETWSDARYLARLRGMPTRYYPRRPWIFR